MAPRTKTPGSWSDATNRLSTNGEHLKNLETKENRGPLIILPRLDIQIMKLKVVGDSELICHRWSEKAIREMLNKQMGIATAGKEKKNPIEDFKATLYTIQRGKVVGKFDLKKLTDDGHPDVWVKGGKFGFPAIAFKDAAVSACTSLGKDVTKVQARQAFHVIGELVPISGIPRMRQDMVRLNGQTADIRHRGGFVKWSTVLNIRFNARVLSKEQVANLFNTAGFAVGVGEWRSEKDGSYGLFHVE